MALLNLSAGDTCDPPNLIMQPNSMHSKACGNTQGGSHERASLLNINHHPPMFSTVDSLGTQQGPS